MKELIYLFSNHFFKKGEQYILKNEKGNCDKCDEIQVVLMK